MVNTLSGTASKRALPVTHVSSNLQLVTTFCSCVKKHRHDRHRLQQVTGPLPGMSRSNTVDFNNQSQTLTEMTQYLKGWNSHTTQWMYTHRHPWGSHQPTATEFNLSASKCDKIMQFQNTTTSQFNLLKILAYQPTEICIKDKMCI